VNDCPFCALFNGGSREGALTLYDDDLLRAAHYADDETPSYLGYLVFGPKRHVTIADLTDSEAEATGLLAVRLSRALKETVHAEKVYVYTFGEAFDHLHFFVVARYPGAPPEFLRLRLLEWPDAPRGNGEEVAALCGRLREQLAASERMASSGW
jgi:diadenosine tetraphosphate (Ap4A) HIT family hydrolase